MHQVMQSFPVTQLESGNTDNQLPPNIRIMAIRVVEFSNGVYKIRKILPKNQHTQRKFLNFESWTNGEPQ